VPSVQIGGCARRISAPSQLRALAFERKPEARRGTRRMPPLRLSDAQLDAIITAAKPIPVGARDAFLRDVAAALAGIVDPGDGDVARAIRTVQRKHFDPPLSTDERQEPHRRAARAVGRARGRHFGPGDTCIAANNKTRQPASPALPGTGSGEASGQKRAAAMGLSPGSCQAYIAMPPKADIDRRDGMSALCQSRHNAMQQISTDLSNYPRYSGLCGLSRERLS
jgi:hypothetical protein